MKLHVELKQYLDQYSPSGEDHVFEFEMADGSTAWDLIRKLHIPEELAAVITVGDEATDGTRVLTEGDRVTIIPPIAGGSRR